MKKIADRRGEIYDYFQGNAGCQKYFFDPTHEEEFVSLLQQYALASGLHRIPVVAS